MIRGLVVVGPIETTPALSDTPPNRTPPDGWAGPRLNPFAAVFAFSVSARASVTAPFGWIAVVLPETNRHKEPPTTAAMLPPTTASVYPNRVRKVSRRRITVVAPVAAMSDTPLGLSIWFTNA